MVTQILVIVLKNVPTDLQMIFVLTYIEDYQLIKPFKDTC